MITGLVQTIQRAKFLLNDNSTTILTGMGVAGTVTTAYLTGRATFKAAQIIQQEELMLQKQNGENGEMLELRKLSSVSKVKLVWRHYIPPGAVCATTITCIIVANKIASKKIAALTVASGISERALQEYKAKVEEKLTERQKTNIRDEIAQDRVSKQPLGSREVILAGTGEVLCYDMHTGRYFQSTMEEIRKAENKVNHSLVNFMHASLSEFYDEIGLPPTTYTDSVGWNANAQVKVVFSTVMSSNDQPCIAIDFENPPFADYHRLHD
jgi:Family of unknown function (DUF6353)